MFLASGSRSSGLCSIAYAPNALSLDYQRVKIQFLQDSFFWFSAIVVHAEQKSVHGLVDQLRSVLPQFRPLYVHATMGGRETHDASFQGLGECFTQDWPVLETIEKRRTLKRHATCIPASRCPVMKTKLGSGASPPHCQKIYTGPVGVAKCRTDAHPSPSTQK